MNELSTERESKLLSTSTPSNTNEGKSIAGFVLGILSIVVPYIGFLLGIVAIFYYFCIRSF